jgi:GDPmannose 4,6-dehydratase
LAKTSLIIGAGGQDGWYLAEHLRRNGHRAIGIDRTPEQDSSPHLHAYVRSDLRDIADLESAINRAAPNEIYYLAALNFSSEDARLRTTPIADVLNVNLMGAVSTLNLISDKLPECRFFYAGSCQVFGEPLESPQNEDTPHSPSSPYAVAKSAGLRLCEYFRKEYGVFAVGGILFNHESPLRRPPFITARLAEAAAHVALGRANRITIRNPSAVVDWGAASDVVAAMSATLAQDAADDYVIATGVGHSVSEFADVAFNHVGETWTDWVEAQDSHNTTAKIPYIGDIARIKARTGWYPRVSFEQMVTEMVDAQIANLSGGVVQAPD